MKCYSVALYHVNLNKNSNFYFIKVKNVKCWRYFIRNVNTLYFQLQIKSIVTRKRLSDVGEIWDKYFNYKDARSSFMLLFLQSSDLLFLWLFFSIYSPYHNYIFIEITFFTKIMVSVLYKLLINAQRKEKSTVINFCESI